MSQVTTSPHPVQKVPAFIECPWTIVKGGHFCAKIANVALTIISALVTGLVSIGFMIARAVRLNSTDEATPPANKETIDHPSVSKRKKGKRSEQDDSAQKEAKEKRRAGETAQAAKLAKQQAEAQKKAEADKRTKTKQKPEASEPLKGTLEQKTAEIDRRLKGQVRQIGNDAYDQMGTNPTPLRREKVTLDATSAALDATIQAHEEKDQLEREEWERKLPRMQQQLKAQSAQLQEEFRLRAEANEAARKAADANEQLADATAAILAEKTPLAVSVDELPEIEVGSKEEDQAKEIIKFLLKCFDNSKVAGALMRDVNGLPIDDKSIEIESIPAFLKKVDGVYNPADIDTLCPFALHEVILQKFPADSLFRKYFIAKVQSLLHKIQVVKVTPMTAHLAPGAVESLIRIFGPFKITRVVFAGQMDKRSRGHLARLKPFQDKDCNVDDYTVLYKDHLSTCLSFSLPPLRCIMYTPQHLASIFWNSLKTEASITLDASRYFSTGKKFDDFNQILKLLITTAHRSGKPIVITYDSTTDKLEKIQEKTQALLGGSRTPVTYKDINTAATTPAVKARSAEFSSRTSVGASVQQACIQASATQQVVQPVVKTAPVKELRLENFEDFKQQYADAADKTPFTQLETIVISNLDDKTKDHIENFLNTCPQKDSSKVTIKCLIERKDIDSECRLRAIALMDIDGVRSAYITETDEAS